MSSVSERVCVASMQALLLHGEQYVEMHAPMPRSGRLLTTARVLDTQDKGKAAVVVLHTESRCALSLFERGATHAHARRQQ